MAKTFLTPINMSNLEVLNHVLHLSQPSTATLGLIYYNTTANRAYIYSGSVYEIVPFIGSGSPSAETVGASAVVGTSNYAARLDHVHAMPGNATSGVDGFMSGADKTKLDAATSSNTASTLVIRDAAARFRAADPSDVQDVATKGYVDALVNGVADWHDSVRGTTTGALAITGRTSTTLTIGGTSLTVDGVTYANGERILVKDSTTGTGAGAWDNGIYSVGGVGSSIVLTRVSDMNTWARVPGAAMFVEEGTTYADTAWVCTSNAGGTIGTTSISFVQFGSAAAYTAANEPTITGTGVYSSTSGNQFRFRAIKANSTKIAVALSTADITIDVTEANLTLNNIGGTLSATKGGTGQTAYAIGDLLYADTTTSLAKLAGVATGNVLLSGGTNTAPAWGKVTLTGHVSGILPLANGGTGQSSAQAAINSLAGAVTSGQYLRGNGTNVVMSAIQAGDVPTLNQNTTGTASNVTGIVAVVNGGTGASSASGAKTNLGFAGIATATIGDGVATSFNVNHTFGTTNVIARVYRVSDGVEVETDVTAINTSYVTISFATGIVPTTNQYRVVVLG